MVCLWACLIFAVTFFAWLCRCFGLLLSRGKDVRSGDMHLLDLVRIFINKIQEAFWLWLCLISGWTEMAIDAVVSTEALGIWVESCLCCSVRTWPGVWSRNLASFTVSHGCSHSGTWNKKHGTLFLDMLNIKVLCFEHGKFYSRVISVSIKAWEASNVTLRASGCFVLMTHFSL